MFKADLIQRKFPVGHHQCLSHVPHVVHIREPQLLYFLTYYITYLIELRSILQVKENEKAHCTAEY